MTIGSIVEKIIARLWLVLIVTIAISLLGYNYLSKDSYVANISVGLNLNNLSISSNNDAASIIKNNSVDESYSTISPLFSKYLTGKYSSISIQEIIAEKIGAKLGKASDKKAIYEISDQGLGYIGLTFISNDKQQSEDFLKAVKEVYKEQIIREWNSERPETYNVAASDYFIEKVATVEPAKEIYALPVIAGLIIGTLAAVSLPYSSKSKA